MILLRLAWEKHYQILFCSLTKECMHKHKLSKYSVFKICQIRSVHYCALHCVPQNSAPILGYLMIQTVDLMVTWKDFLFHRERCFMLQLWTTEVRARKVSQEALSFEMGDIWMFTALEKLSNKLQKRGHRTVDTLIKMFFPGNVLAGLKVASL